MTPKIILRTERHRVMEVAALRFPDDNALIRVVRSKYKFCWSAMIGRWYVQFKKQQNETVKTREPTITDVLRT